MKKTSLIIAAMVPAVLLLSASGIYLARGEEHHSGGAHHQEHQEHHEEHHEDHQEHRENHPDENRRVDENVHRDRDVNGNVNREGWHGGGVNAPGPVIVPAPTVVQPQVEVVPVDPYNNNTQSPN